MRKILIAEDEPHILRVLAMWLSRHGYTIVEAPDGAAALEVLAREPVDLLISDMNMPNVDGLTLVRTVREARGLTMPILLLTARCDQERIRHLIATFQRVHLYPKPFVPSRLIADIETALTSPDVPQNAEPEAEGQWFNVEGQQAKVEHPLS